MNDLLRSDWFSGPMFMWESEIPTPEDVIPDLAIGDPEIRKAQTLQTSALQASEPISIADSLSKFSSWSRTIQAVACLVLQAEKIKSNVPSALSEWKCAECVIIRDLQSQTYEKEIQQLKKRNQLTKNNKLYQHPIVIPKAHHVTRLIIAHNYEKIKHQGI